MKKFITATLIFFYLAMGTMFLWGFIDKQSKESSTPVPPTTAGSSNQNSSSSGSSTSSGSTAPPTPSEKTYSMSEVSSHNKASDCWLDISGNVYEVTSYLDYHPGGADIIIMFCGQDATEAYNTKGGNRGSHSSRANATLAGYKIGVIK